MRYYLLLLMITANSCAYSQQQSFDIASFTAPKGWKKQTTEKEVEGKKERKRETNRGSEGHGK